MPTGSPRLRRVLPGPSGPHHRASVPLVVLAVLVATGLTITTMHQMNRQADRQRFSALNQKLGDEIVRRVGVYAYGLMGTRSAFASNPAVDRAGFRRLVESRDPEHLFPAATGLGYIERVPVAERDAYLARVRADGAPAFDVRDLAPYDLHDDHLIIKYIEPAGPNRAALGLDIGQEPRRRAAAEAAMETGKPVLTAPITLVQAGEQGAGFLLLLPDYEAGRPLETAAQRRAALRGWAYMTLLAERVFSGADAQVDGELDFEVFVGDDLTCTERIFSQTHGPAPGTVSDAATRRELVTVPIGGQQWHVAATPSSAFRAASTAPMLATAGGGVLLAFLLALMLINQAGTLRRAEGIARMMTLDLHHAAHTDRLTGLPNRSRIVETIDQALDRGRRVPGYHFAVLFLDFDRFKVINDTLGHEAGDRLLCEISARLIDTLRSHDIAALSTGSHPGHAEIRPTAARLGGDEFIVMLDGLSHPDDAARVADRLLQALGRRYLIDGKEVVSTASIGVAPGRAAHANAEAVIRDADTAMYEAKRAGAGAGAYRVFDHAMREREQSRVAIEQDLHLAIEHRELALEFQPIVSLTTGAVESCEALVRWDHPTHGRIGPDRFIPLAEANGVILPLGAWILDTALARFAAWRRRPGFPADVSLSVNLSRKQLTQPSLVSGVTDALARHGVPADRLHLEVTESEVMANPDAALANLQRLRGHGIRIDIDDFGTGHSSLACLHKFPIDVLKIDRSFIANLAQDGSLTAVLRTVTELARTLKFAVVAEGIETDHQLAVVRGLRCDFAQGYYFSRPLSGNDAAAYCIDAANPPAAPPLRLAA